MSTTRINPTPVPPAETASTQLPEWFSDEYIPTFSSGAAHCFILSGDIYGATVQGISHVRFLQSVLSKRRMAVAYYNRATGIRFLLESMKDAALQLIGSTPGQASAANPMAAALAASGVGVQPTETSDVFSSARSPLAALAVLGQLLRSPKGKGQVAVIIDFADTLCPQKDKGTMSDDDRLLFVSLLTWGQDAQLSERDNPVFLLSRNPGELHSDLLSSSSGYKLIEIPLPSKEERATYLTWYLKQREDNVKPIILKELTVPELANITAGLNLRQIEDVLLAAGRAGARWRIVHVKCADAVAEERLARSDPSHPAKNRNAALYRRIKQQFEPITQAKLDVDTTSGTDEVLTMVEEYLTGKE